ncbi:MAG: histidine phosphatase family protein [Pseudomonadota bacterium]
MKTPIPRIAAALALSLLAFSSSAADAWAELTQPGTIVIFRHATAPGVGDPAGFKLDSCPTQRNLDDKGRAEARRLGEQFRGRKIAVGAVMTSQWCRTRETARLAFGDGVKDEPTFNSTFSAAGEVSDAQTAQARALLSRWRGPGALVVVTHQVNITALTGVVPSSAEGVVVRPAADGSLKVLGTLKP